MTDKVFYLNEAKFCRIKNVGGLIERIRLNEQFRSIEKGPMCC